MSHLKQLTLLFLFTGSVFSTTINDFASFIGKLYSEQQEIHIKKEAFQTFGDIGVRNDGTKIISITMSNTNSSPKELNSLIMRFNGIYGGYTRPGIVFYETYNWKIKDGISLYLSISKSSSSGGMNEYYALYLTISDDKLVKALNTKETLELHTRMREDAKSNKKKSGMQPNVKGKIIIDEYKINKGNIDKERLLGVLFNMNNITNLNYSYNKLRRINTTLVEGDATFKVCIGDDGKASSIYILNSTITDPDLINVFKGRINQWQFMPKKINSSDEFLGHMMGGGNIEDVTSEESDTVSDLSEVEFRFTIKWPAY